MQKGDTSTTCQSFPGCRQIIREAFLKKKVPEDALDIIISSVTEATVKQYEGYLKQWWEFTQKQRSDFFNPDVTTIIQFLTTKFNEGNSYGSINSMRSAISFIATKDFSNDNTLSRFLRGVYKKRPSRPKYSTTWDTSIVLNYIEKLSNSNNLKILSEKTSTLLALTTAHRLQTLSIINIENIAISENVIKIKIPDPIKTSKRNSFQPELILPMFKENPKLCVVSFIKEYLQVTKNLRGKVKNLFISTRKPHKAVTSQTIGHWIKNLLEKAGINTEQFSAYSTRHASVSKAFKRGLDLNVIRKTAGWSKKSEIFARFYNRPIQTSEDLFARSILNK